RAHDVVRLRLRKVDIAMRRPPLLLCFALLVFVLTSFAQAQCNSALTASGPIFNSAFIPANSGFATASLNLNGGNATVKANTIGIGEVSGLSLFQGRPGNSTLVMVFTDQTNGFINGDFRRTVAIDPVLAAQIAGNPSNFFFSLDTSRGSILSPLGTS